MNIWCVCFCKYVIFLELQFFVSVSVWVSRWFRSCWLLSVFYKNTHIIFHFHFTVILKSAWCPFFSSYSYFIFFNNHCVFSRREHVWVESLKIQPFSRLLTLMNFIPFNLFTHAISWSCRISTYFWRLYELKRHVCMAAKLIKTGYLFCNVKVNEIYCFFISRAWIWSPRDM